jgi:phosphate transport system substrate-binding protein
MKRVIPRAGIVALALCQWLFATPLIAEEAQTLFRLTGSNTIGAELAPMLVKGYLQSLGAQDIHQRSAGEKHWISAQLNGRLVQVPIIALGSSTGFKALNDGSADIGMASRKIKPLELEMLARFGNLDSASAEYVIGLDALVIAVHPSNPISQLSLEQLQQIYRGEIRNWRELGGADIAIQPLHRDIESGTRTTFDEEIFGKSLPAWHGSYEVSGNAETRRITMDDTGAGAIGYLPFADAHDIKKVAIKAGDLAAIVPDRGIIATEDFPLSRRLYLYKSPSRHHPQVDDFLRYAESSAGQDLVAQVGFINLTPVALKLSPYANAPDTYRELMTSGERLSISFRFTDGSTDLDNRALRDLHRLQAFMESGENRQLSLTLVGFSDRKTNNNIADLISRFRALKVQGALLRQHQLGDARVLALGAFAPVTVNRQQAPVKNSRVEVWIN